MTIFQARYKPGKDVTVYASSLIRGGRFVKIIGDKVSTGDYPAAECGLGERSFGVSQADSGPTSQDANSVERRVDVARRGAIARVVPGSNITYGDAIQSDAQGRAITLATAVAALLDTGVVGSNNAIRWTARAPGTAGNSITVTLADPGGTTASLSVDVAENGLDITVNLARASSALSSTAQNVMDAIEANGEANTLVTVVDKSTSTGAGIVAAVTKTSLAGGSDAEGGGHTLGFAVESGLSSDDFIEVDLI